MFSTVLLFNSPVKAEPIYCTSQLTWSEVTKRWMAQAIDLGIQATDLPKTIMVADARNGIVDRYDFDFYVDMAGAGHYALYLSRHTNQWLKVMV